MITEVNLKNAIRVFRQDGVLTTDKKERLCISTVDKEAVMKWLKPMVNE